MERSEHHLPNIWFNGQRIVFPKIRWSVRKWFTQWRIVWFLSVRVFHCLCLSCCRQGRNLWKAAISLVATTYLVQQPLVCSSWSGSNPSPSQMVHHNWDLSHCTFPCYFLSTILVLDRALFSCSLILTTHSIIESSIYSRVPLNRWNHWGDVKL